MHVGVPREVKNREYRVALTPAGVTELTRAGHTVLAVVLVVLPVGWLLLRWLPWRLGWVRDAGAARRLASADPDVLAARALATAPLSRLAALPPGTAAAWRAGDPAATQTLAAVELDRLGLTTAPLAGNDPRLGLR